MIPALRIASRESISEAKLAVISCMQFTVEVFCQILPLPASQGFSGKLCIFGDADSTKQAEALRRKWNMQNRGESSESSE